MKIAKTLLVSFGVCVSVSILTTSMTKAATCGNMSAGFETWKKSFATEAKSKGSNPRAIAALMGTNYSTATISADRSQSSFKLSLDAFMQRRFASGVISQGRQLKVSNAELFASIQKRYGVPPGPLLAIWGMETMFGWYTGNQNTISAVATLAYDCRRTKYFTEQLYAALKLIDNGVLTQSTRGATHGEVGLTQFLPMNILLYGTDGDGNGRIDLNGKADALASTANFLRGHGWIRLGGYQPGEVNFPVIQAWNAATVYQQALAIIGRRIDGK